MNFKIKKIIFCCLTIYFTGCEPINFDEEKREGSQYIFESYWNEIDRHFSFFEYLDLDWDSVYNEYDKKISNNLSEHQLFATLEEMTVLLKDGHTNLFSYYGTAGYRGIYEYPYNIIRNMSHYFLSYYNLNDVFEYGTLKNNNLGYIKIKTFNSTIETEQYEKIDFILEELSNLNAIIIDVRSNGGGSSNYANLIAQRFNDSKRYVFKSRRRNGPNHNDFTEWSEFYLDPLNGSVYNKPVAILTNRQCYSSTEWFISCMDVIPNTTLIGDTTGGGSGNPLIRELPNGWVLRVSNTQKQLPNGKDYQYVGISPDIPVWISRNDSEKNIDRILETAMQHLSNLH